MEIQMQEDPSPETKSHGRLPIGIVFLALFVVITALVVSKTSQQFDAAITLSINRIYAGSALNSFLVFATEYGREYFWIPIVAIMLLFGKRDTKTLAIELAILFIIGIAAGEAMKHIMFRPRPFNTVTGITTRVPRDTDSSYPSGHALIVSIGAIYALARFRRKGIASLLALEAIIVCYSRIYVGVHYLLDVVSGVFLGGAIVFLGLFLINGYLQKQVVFLTDLSEKILGRMHVPGAL